MELFYNGIDILKNKNVLLSACTMTDNASGEADTISLTFSDVSGLWGIWKPNFDDVIIVKDSDWSSGTMYIDDIIDTDTVFIIKAVSLPPQAKQSKSTTWENVKFSKIANDLSIESGLELVTYEITDYNYTRFDRVNESTLQALNRLCMREGYCLKITNGKAIIYNEKSFENKASVKSISPITRVFENQNIGKKSIEIKWLDGNGELISATATDETINRESDIITNIVVYNIAEAQRFSKGILRYCNKKRITGNFATDKDLTLASGNVITLDIQGMFKGNYFIEQIKHEFIGSKTYFKVRKAIEGDY